MFYLCFLIYLFYLWRFKNCFIWIFFIVFYLCFVFFIKLFYVWLMILLFYLWFWFYKFIWNLFDYIYFICGFFFNIGIFLFYVYYDFLVFGSFYRGFKFGARGVVVSKFRFYEERVYVYYYGLKVVFFVIIR